MIGRWKRNDDRYNENRHLEEEKSERKRDLNKGQE